MSNDDEYRKQANDAQGFANRAISDDDRAAWLRIAQGWLALIRKPRQSEQSASDKFDAADTKQGTHQKRSDAEH
jgi:hypothetical protein